VSLATDLIGQLINDEGPMAELRQRAARSGSTLVLCEGEDPRVVAAALALRELGLARSLLIGDPAMVRAEISGQGADPGQFEVIATDDSRTEAVADLLVDRRSQKGLTLPAARKLAQSPVILGAGLVALGVADAMVAGARHPSAQVIRAGLWCVGPAPGIRTVSGSFLMLPPDGRRPLLFADSAILIEPDEDQLVDIGRASAATWTALFGSAPRIATLSFSTKGSADHPAAARMSAVAARLVGHGLVADGELQADAALVVEVARDKAPGSAIAGDADVLLFPDLQSGNIAYKLVQRLGGWRAVGPLVQGLARPVFDLSRGCDASEIVDTAAIAILSAAAGSREERK
jgi:phosphate acetyltransferase